MRMVDIIQKKRDGFELSTQEIDEFVQGYTRGDIPDYQASALLMAICLQGMTSRETADLTSSMTYSGQTIDLSVIDGTVIDKHSTGGVGDTTTLVVAPLVAACGAKVGKMSGRGLGHTGGTLDKLESIPGFNVEIDIDTFIDLVNKNGVAVVGQTSDLAPADKKIYALRDVTATVQSMPLIASSIMSKKLAAGAQAMVLDVKTGSGAFMKTVDDAFALASEMVSIGTNLKREVIALVTDMDQPLGNAIGNSLDVREAIEILQGQYKGTPLYEICIQLAVNMLLASGVAYDRDDALDEISDALHSGKALDKMRVMIQAQGGDARVCDDVSLLGAAREVVPVSMRESGYITFMDTAGIGTAAQMLGAGRATKDDPIDHTAGIYMRKRLGDRVEANETVAEFHVNDEKRLQEAIDVFQNAITLGDERVEKPLLYGIVTKDGEERYI